MSRTTRSFVPGDVHRQLSRSGQVAPAVVPNLLSLPDELLLSIGKEAGETGVLHMTNRDMFCLFKRARWRAQDLVFHSTLTNSVRRLVLIGLSSLLFLAGVAFSCRHGVAVPLPAQILCSMTRGVFVACSLLLIFLLTEDMLCALLAYPLVLILFENGRCVDATQAGIWSLTLFSIGLVAYAWFALSIHTVLRVCFLRISIARGRPVPLV